MLPGLVQKMTESPAFLPSRFCDLYLMCKYLIALILTSLPVLSIKSYVTNIFKLYKDYLNKSYYCIKWNYLACKIIQFGCIKC